MKKINYLLPILLAAAMLPGCKKFLDVKSKTDVVQSDLLSNEAGYQDAMAGVYYIMSSRALYGDKLTMSLLDVLAGRYSIQFGNYYNGTFSVDGYGTAAYYEYPSIKSMTEDIWLNMYKAIANDNNILGQIDARQDMFTGDNYRLIKGEALGLRAFMHFDLLRMFGPSYLTGKDTAGIPYVTTFSSATLTPLSTVKAITDSVIADLEAAAILLQGDDLKTVSGDNDWLNNRKCHFNYWATQATLARVYLFRGEKQKALEYAQKLIAYNALRFTTSTELESVPFHFSLSPEQIFSLKVPAMTEDETWARNYFLSSNGGMLGNERWNVESIYETNAGNGTDYRFLSLWRPYNDLYNLAKYWQDEEVDEQYLVPLIRLPEMYYIAAECSPTNEGTQWLNTVRTNRGLPTLPDGLTDEQFQNELFKEYQKELYAEGQLFYYYKRLNLPSIVDYDNSNLIYTTPGYYKFPLPDDEIRLGGR